MNAYVTSHTATHIGLVCPGWGDRFSHCLGAYVCIGMHADVSMCVKVGSLYQASFSVALPLVY